ncbi:MAG: DNA mismatch repair protein MutL [Candidatus Dojkabacteria bacterium]|nr:MAG: DNA mismatch repair protein MutL [Candidatus Dojkabacteria bacterium]
MIKPLPKEVINQIAAGEVVERPASVVKELVENSLDAKATEIRVNIEKYGIGKIQVIDNGTGIARRDFQHLFQKHSTSKINTIADLENIITFGFRGEALASIAAVAKVTLQTHHQDDPIGSEISIEFGRNLRVKPSSITIGSNFIIEDLFGEIVVRRKFLKSPATENKAIKDVLYRFIVSNPQVDFVINIDGQLKTFLKTDHIKRISAVLDIDVDNIIPIQSEGRVKVYGFLIHPRITFRNKANQFIFVNSRPVNDPIAGKAVLEGYDTFLMKNQFPGYVLFVDVPPNEVDVNIHPRKLEVRFINASEVYKAVRSTVNHRLTSTIREKTRSNFVQISELDTKPNNSQSNIDKPSDPIAEFEDFLRSDIQQSFGRKNHISDWITKKALDFNKEIISDDNRDNTTNTDHTHTKSQKTAIQKRDDTERPTLFEIEGISHKEQKFLCDLDNATVLLNSYIITANQKALLIIDMHAASERIFYERYMNQLKSRTVSAKVLLVPEIIDFDEFTIQELLKHSETFSEFGFSFEAFGSKSIKITQVPDGIRMDDFKQVFISIADELTEHDLSTNLDHKIYHNIAAKLACHTAVRFGDKITKPEIISLLKQLMECEDPYNCPHGRPIMIEINTDELLKKFKRCAI